VFEAASGFLATRAIAGGSQNRPADCLQFHLAAWTYLGEVLLLFQVHRDRPFVDPVYEVILALLRNVRNASEGDLKQQMFDVCFAPESRCCATRPFRAKRIRQSPRLGDTICAGTPPQIC
jgi:hypothetical protein